MESYQSFDEAPSTNEVLYLDKIFSKFCYFGLVGSKSWDLTFAVIIGQCLRIYDSEETYQLTPEQFVYQLELISLCHLPSMIFTKDYSKDNNHEIFIHYFYILRDNGFWGPTKLIKIGNSSRNAIERLHFEIKRATKHHS